MYTFQLRIYKMKLVQRHARTHAYTQIGKNWPKPCNVLAFGVGFGLWAVWAVALNKLSMAFHSFVIHTTEFHVCAERKTGPKFGWVVHSLGNKFKWQNFQIFHLINFKRNKSQIYKLRTFSVPPFPKKKKHWCSAEIHVWLIIITLRIVCVPVCPKVYYMPVNVLNIWQWTKRHLSHLV